MVGEDGASVCRRGGASSRVGPTKVVARTAVGRWARSGRVCQRGGAVSEDDEQCVCAAGRRVATTTATIDRSTRTPPTATRLGAHSRGGRMIFRLQLYRATTIAGRLRRRTTARRSPTQTDIIIMFQVIFMGIVHLAGTAVALRPSLNE